MSQTPDKTKPFAVSAIADTAGAYATVNNTKLSAGAFAPNGGDQFVTSSLPAVKVRDMSDSNNFKRAFKMEGYAAEDIKVETDDSRVILEAAHVEHPVKGKTVQHTFTYEYLLPSDVNVAQVEAAWSKTANTLCIKAPRNTKQFSENLEQKKPIRPIA